MVKRLFGLFFLFFVILRVFSQDITVEDTVLYLNGEKVDTLCVGEISKRFAWLTDLGLDENDARIKASVSRIYFLMQFDKTDQKLQFRYQDPLLVDDVFIYGVVLGYREDHFLIEFHYDNKYDIKGLHKSQIADKSLKSFRYNDK